MQLPFKLLQRVALGVFGELGPLLRLRQGLLKPRRFGLPRLQFLPDRSKLDLKFLAFLNHLVHQFLPLRVFLLEMVLILLCFLELVLVLVERSSLGLLQLCNLSARRLELGAQCTDLSLQRVHLRAQRCHRSRTVFQ